MDINSGAARARQIASEGAHPGLLEEIGHLVAGVEHAGFHGCRGDADDAGDLIDRFLVVVDEIDHLAVCRRKLGQALLHNGVAILGAHDRLGIVGGDLKIESAPKRGATLFVRVPIPKAHEKEKKAK